MSELEVPRRIQQTFRPACHAAWCTAYQGHDGQVRSADHRPYITHPETVAQVVQVWVGTDEATNIALLHDYLEDCNVTPDELAKRHGFAVARAVQALSKDKSLAKSEQGAEAKCRLVRALPSLGPAVGIVKLVDRAHNMVTAKHLRREKQTEMASDARYYFAPLARQLGLSGLAQWYETFSPGTLENWSDDEFVRYMTSNFSIQRGGW